VNKNKESHRLSVFVVMPFDDEFRDAYELDIKPACAQAGADCARVDEQLFLENILKRIYHQIESADVIIAEMTSRNPNVFYEVGYSHGLDKPVILLTKSAVDIPFDLQHYPHIVYEGQIRTLKSEIEKKVRWCT
jgi:nucleoside 2-deoxyribosyltransferase